MNNLTKEEKAKVFAMYAGIPCVKHPCDSAAFTYLGQVPIRFCEKNYYQGSLKPVLHGDWSGGTNPQYSDAGMCEWVDITLLLTPLSEITDEDAIEVAKITDAVGGSNLLVDRRKEHLLIYHRMNDTVYTSNPKDCVYFYPESFEVFYQNDNGDIQDTTMCRIHFIIQFLISRGYSVPLFFGIDHWANGMDAIQLGIGIAKTKEG